MGKAQRLKGHNYEREKAKQLTDLGFPSKRLLEYQEGFGLDILPKDLPIGVQCKVGKNPPWYKAVEEAYTGLKKMNSYRMPIAFVKKDNVGEYAVLKLNDFLKILATIATV